MLMAEKHLNKNLIEQEKYIEKNLQVYLGVWKKKKRNKKKRSKNKEEEAYRPFIRNCYNK